jgi:hypothetical protein
MTNKIVLHQASEEKAISRIFSNTKAIACRQEQAAVEAA